MTNEYRVQFKPFTSDEWAITEPLDLSIADVFVDALHSSGWKARVIKRKIEDEILS